MNHQTRIHIEHTTLALILACLILTATLIVVAATYPQSQEDGTIAYRGWIIYQPSNTTSGYVATKPGQQPITNGDLPDLISDIDDTQR